jgi:ABC-2 type transport system ATP-binding protein
MGRARPPPSICSPALPAPDSGVIRIAGIKSGAKPTRIQRLIGVVPDESNLYPEMSGFENLCFCAAMYGIRRDERRRRARRLLVEFGLDQAGGRKFGGYSKGMKRKLTIAAGIIHKPQILFLDEPTSGIDLASARRIRERIKELNQDGCTVFLTTHYLEEAERLCGRIAFIVKGQVVKVDAVSSLMQDFEGRQILQFTLSRADEGLCALITRRFPHLTCRLISGEALRVDSAQPIDIVPLVNLFKESDLEVMEAKRIRPSLEEVFVQVTGLDSGVMENSAPAGGKLN